MRFFKDFFKAFKVLFMVVLIIAGFFAPIILGSVISSWFLCGYVITIPLMYACFSYLYDMAEK